MHFLFVVVVSWCCETAVSLARFSTFPPIRFPPPPSFFLDSVDPSFRFSLLFFSPRPHFFVSSSLFTSAELAEHTALHAQRKPLCTAVMMACLAGSIRSLILLLRLLVLRPFAHSHTFSHHSCRPPSPPRTLPSVSPNSLLPRLLLS